jgi:hypothetical protein
MQKKVASGQGATKRRKDIYFNQLLFLLPTMQGRSPSVNFTPPPTANEGDQEVMTEHEVGEVPNAKAATYRQQKRPKRTYEKSLLKIIKEKNRDDIDEDKSFLMSLVPAFKNLDGEQKFMAKVEFLNVMRRITFCQPPHHVDFHLILTCLVHILQILEPSPMFTFHMEHITIFVKTFSMYTMNPCKIPIPTSHQAHSHLLPPAVVILMHTCHPLMEIPCHPNRFRTVRATLDILWLYLLSFVTKRKSMFEGYNNDNKRSVHDVILM